MKFILTPQQWILADLDPIEWQFLDLLPHVASGEDFSSDCQRRLYPDPIDVPAAERPKFAELVQDWDDYVRPDLQSDFTQARDQVSRDLALALARDAGFEFEADDEDDGEEDDWEFDFDEEEDDLEEPEDWDEEDEEGEDDDGEVPTQLIVDRSSAEAWYSTLNQARLLMNEAYDLAEAEERLSWGANGPTGEMNIEPARLYLLAQYDFYTALQSILIEAMMRIRDESEEE